MEKNCKAAEGQDGIGGQMALAKEKRTAKKPQGKGNQKKTASRGRAKLNEAADKTLEKHSTKIADSLYQSLLKGNATSAKLLIALADGQIDSEGEDAAKKLCSLAEELAAEPEWKGGMPEEGAEASRGDHEPEG